MSPKGLSSAGRRDRFRVSATDPEPKSAAAVRLELDLPSLGGNNRFTGENVFEGQTELGPTTIPDSTLIIGGGLEYNGTDPAVFNGGAEFNDEARMLAGTRVAYVAKTGAYTLTDADCVVHATSGTWAATLPSAVARLGKLFVVRNSGAGTVTVTPDGAETIDGAATLPVAAGGVAWLISDGANWITV